MGENNTLIGVYLLILSHTFFYFSCSNIIEVLSYTFLYLETRTRKLKEAYDKRLKQKLDTFKDSTWHTQRHKHVAIMHLNSWIW